MQKCCHLPKAVRLERLQSEDETQQRSHLGFHMRQQREARAVSGFVLGQKLVCRVIKEPENKVVSVSRALFPSHLLP